MIPGESSRDTFVRILKEKEFDESNIEKFDKIIEEKSRIISVAYLTRLLHEDLKKSFKGILSMKF